MIKRRRATPQFFSRPAKPSRRWPRVGQWKRPPYRPDPGAPPARRFPNAKLIEFPDLGHAGWLQDPERVGAALVTNLIGAKP